MADETPDLDAVIQSFRHRNLERPLPATVFSNWSVNDLRSFLKAMKRSKGTSSMKKEQVSTSTHLLADERKLPFEAASGSHPGLLFVTKRPQDLHKLSFELI